MKSSQVPLFVDLDGTLVASDCAFELLLARLKRRPLDLFLILYWLLRGRACLKARLAAEEAFDASLLPYRQEVCDFLRAERANQRIVYLATAADRRIADRVAAHLGFFSGVIASDETCNLKGIRKLVAIKALAKDGFAYAGDSSADLPIWAEAETAILVNAPRSVIKKLNALGKATVVLATPPATFMDFVRAIRAHQWLKNLLIFVPLLTSFHVFIFDAWVNALAAFAAISFCASATYVLNDLCDLASDRSHKNKRFRPFAAGRLSIRCGCAIALGGMSIGLGIAAWQSLPLLWVTVAYIITTLSYSVYLKTRVLMDVIILAALYTIRIFTGAIAIHVTVSVWLLVFALFIFLSLALIKRCSELVSLRASGIEHARGRNYNTEDLQIFWPLGAATAVSSVLVFALYIKSGEMPGHYGRPQLLWLVAIGLFYWLGRMWIKTARGEMDDDPLVYTIKDRGSRIVISAMVITTLAAFFWHG